MNKLLGLLDHVDTILIRYMVMYLFGYNAARFAYGVFTGQIETLLLVTALSLIAAKYIKRWVAFQPDWADALSMENLKTMGMSFAAFILGYFVVPFGIFAFEVAGNHYDVLLGMVYMAVNMVIAEPFFNKLFIVKGFGDGKQPPTENS